MLEQGSPEWFAARCGKVTASRVHDIIARTKSGPAASRKNYEAQIICERLTGKVEETFTSAAMQWGKDQEPLARMAYEFMLGVTVEQVGFVDHPKLEGCGASPDGLVGDDGLVEIKCPNTATHLETLLGSSIEAKYITQMQWQMACTGRKWCDFVSFDPRMPEHLQMHRERVDRNDDFIRSIETEVAVFLTGVEQKIKALSTIKLGEVA